METPITAISKSHDGNLSILNLLAAIGTNIQSNTEKGSNSSILNPMRIWIYPILFHIFMRKPNAERFLNKRDIRQVSVYGDSVKECDEPLTRER
jgi:hypothetical protein